MSDSSSDNTKLDSNKIIEDGNKTNPAATRFLFTGFAVLSLAAVVLSWQRAPGVLIPVAISITALSILITLLTKAVTYKNTLAANTILWSVLSAVVVLIVLFILSVFFGIPERGAVLFARLLEAPQLALAREPSPDILIGPTTPPRWPVGVQDALDATDDEYNRINALSKRPSVTVRGGTIASEGGQVAVNILDLENGTIITNGTDLTIEAVTIRSGNGAIRSFAAAQQRSSGKLVVKEAKSPLSFTTRSSAN